MTDVTATQQTYETATARIEAIIRRLDSGEAAPMDMARLKEIPLFKDLGDDDLKTIATFAEEKSVGSGETLVREGDFSAELIAIEEGTAQVRHGDEVVAELGPGDYFGEV